MYRPDATLAGFSATVRRASHADEKYQGDIKDCDEMVAKRAGLDYIAHITSGIWDFSVHLPTSGLRPEDFDQAARQLSLIAARFDATAEQLDSGPLIRVVVQGDNGALFHVLKVAGQNFFAATINGTPETVNLVDRDLAEIANRAAQRLGSPSLLWGGYRKRGDSGDMWFPGRAVPPDERPVRPETTDGQKTVTEQVVSRCCAALDRNDVHFVGLYRHDTLIWRADLFADPALRSLFQRVTPATRRHGYDRVLRQVMMQAGRIYQLLSLVHSNLLTQLVLDVARGAIYILPLGDHEHYLVGVTLLQTQVSDAGDKMTALHRDLTVTAFRPDGSLALPVALLAGRLPAVARARQLDGDLVDAVP